MIEFLRDNWKLILEIVVFLASVIFFIVKKKPLRIVDGVKSRIVKFLPAIIKFVEKDSKGKGSEKLAEALAMVHILLYEDFDMNEEEVSYYDDFVIERIEDILSTPQKKGV